MAMIEAVIFDMDGVLIDSVESAYRVKTRILKEDYGVDLASVPDPHGEAHKGASVRDLVAAVNEHTGAQVDEATFTPKVVANIITDLEESGMQADPELVAFLRDLHAHGVPLGVATTSIRDSAENKLRILGIKEFFTVIVTGDDVTEHKPHPEAYRVAMERLHASPAKSFVFEDSVQGIAAGKAAGANVVGVTNYNVDKTALQDTVLTISKWDEVSYQKLLSLIA